MVERIAEGVGNDFSPFLEAVDKRHAFFHSAGCRLADHGMAYVPDADATSAELDAIVEKALRGEAVERADREKMEAAFLVEVGKLNHARGWAQQFHVGVFRNTNSRMLNAVGPDTGFDSIGDDRQGPGLIRLLDRLHRTDELTKTILYNSNPVDNELFATMIGNYQDGRVPGKIQWGSGWWFLDQKDGMERQMNTLSNMGLISCFVGMLTDSRSFLSFPRHEYFRRILCNLLGQDVENGEIPADMSLLGEMVENICFNNSNNYFEMDL